MDITVTHQMGGMMEFARTDVYPEYLVFTSKSLHRTWRFKKKKETKKGSLKVKGKIVFNYLFDEEGCKIQKVDENGVGGKWESPEMIMEMRD